MASLRADGMYADVRDLLTIVWMVGKSTGRRLFMNEVGMGSREQDFELPDCIILSNFSSVTLANDLILSSDLIIESFSCGVLSVAVSAFELRSFLMFEILSLKYFPKLLARSFSEL